MGRKTLTVAEATKERFDGLKRDDESQTDLVERALDALETVEQQDGDVNTDRTQVPDGVLTEDHLSDLQTMMETAVENGLDTVNRR